MKSAEETHRESPDEVLDRILSDPSCRVHFVGLAGAGMSALAEFRLRGGGAVSGSDRFFDRGELSDEKRRFEDLGARVLVQDGRGIASADIVAASTAVEAAIPDLVEARRCERPIYHRSEILASFIRRGRSVAVTGTSGKSTVVGMLWSALRAAKEDPALITGGELMALRGPTARGNAAVGSGPLIVEADESDRSVSRYAPSLGLILNLHKDHAPAEEILPAFRSFKDQCREACLLGDDPALRPLRVGAEVFGFGEEAGLRGHNLQLEPFGSRFEFEGIEVAVPMPGRHNAENALAALAAAKMLGAAMPAVSVGLECFGGIHRRYEVVGEAEGVLVIDDFAHNPAKIAASLKAARRQARARGGRLLAIFQPHGFAPTKFYRSELVEAFAEILDPDDQAFLQEIFFAGGSAVKDISSAEVIHDLQDRGVNASLGSTRKALCEKLANTALSGDVVLSMGARDPGLNGFAQQIFERLSVANEG